MNNACQDWDYEGVTDYEVVQWEEKNREFKLWVCSLCGLIASDCVDHDDCTLQDWWLLNVRAFKKPGKSPEQKTFKEVGVQ